MQTRGTIESGTIEHRVLRRLAVLGIVFGVIGTLGLGWWFWRSGSWRVWTWWRGWTSGMDASYGVWRMANVIEQYSVVLLLASSIEIFRWKASGRLLLVLWAIVAIAAHLTGHTASLVLSPPPQSFTPVNFLARIASIFDRIDFPLCLLLILRRDELKNVLATDQGHGFDVLMTRSTGPSLSLEEALVVEPVEHRQFDQSVARAVGIVGLIFGIVAIVPRTAQLLDIHRWGFNFLYRLLGPIGTAIDAAMQANAFVLIAGALGILLGMRWGKVVFILSAIISIVASTAYLDLNIRTFSVRSVPPPSFIAWAGYAFDLGVATVFRNAFEVMSIVLLLGWKRAELTPPVASPMMPSP